MTPAEDTMPHPALHRIVALVSTLALAACGGAGGTLPPAGTADGRVVSAARTVAAAPVALPGERFNAVPGDRFNAIPGVANGTGAAACGERFNAIPGERFNAIPGERFNAVPGERFNAIPGNANGCGAAGGATCGERFNAVPGERFNAVPGERFNAIPGSSNGCGAPLPGSTQRVCAHANAGEVECNLSHRSDVDANPNPNPAVVWGWQPKHLQAAYNTPSATQGAGETVAIVDAYDDPTAESDLAIYRARMGLPACTSANGCFSKVAQDGDADHLPRADGGWAAEIALDTQMVSAICPLCKIVVVEAKSAGLTDLERAVATAVSFHPIAVSNSYYAPEAGLRDIHPQVYDAPGIAFTAAAGDGGYGATYPADIPSVTAVAGTTLVPNGSPRGFGESVWSGTSSGCSTRMPKPSWQDDTGCRGRTIADVAVVADPRTGVAFYTSSAPAGIATGWLVGGGTSAGAPIVAAIYALAGNAPGPLRLWTDRSGLIPITAGSNGTCPVAYLCTATGAYSGPGGNGAPWGVAAF